MSYKPDTDLDTHLRQQEKMGGFLSTAKPVYQEVRDVKSFVDQVGTATSTVVKILSFGPKASDKSVR